MRARAFVRSLLAGPVLVAALALAGPLLPSPATAQANTFTVTQTSGNGSGSLTRAIQDSNATPGTNRIVFDLPGPCAAQSPCTIAIPTALPAVTRAVTIDGTSQPGYAGVPVVVIDGRSAGSADGLVVRAAGTTVRGLEIARFGRRGLVLEASGVVAANVIRRNGDRGILVAASATGTVVEGNLVGIGPDGAGGDGNGSHGLEVAGSGTRVGGTTAAARNVISGNRGAGIHVTGAGIVVEGNYVGTNVAGTAAVPNSAAGIRVEGASGARIGGTAPGAGNVLAGNAQQGLLLTGSDTVGTVVQGNRIGTDAAGAAAIPNGNSGIGVTGAVDGATLGGVRPGEANLLRGNGMAGVGFDGRARGIRITGNSIAQNSQLGIRLQAGGNAVLANDGLRRDDQANRGMDHPVLGAAITDSGWLHVAGHVGSAAGQAAFAAVTVELFVADPDPSGFGEGQAYVGALTTGADGRFAGLLYAPGVAAGARMTATATDSDGNTSEFGPLATVTAGTAPAPAPAGEWRFDETGWSGVAGEAADSAAGRGGRARNGATTDGATPARPGSPGTCRYGVFDGSSRYVELPATVPRAGPLTTVTAWIRVANTAGRAGGRIWTDDDANDGYALSFGDPGAGRLRLFVRRPQLVTVDTAAVIQPNTWYFVAAVVDATHARTARVHVYAADGTPVTTVTGSLAGFSPGTGRVAIGGELDGAPDGEGNAAFRFPGAIDEVRFYAAALTPNALRAVLDETRPCGAVVERVSITTSVHGLYCLDHAVTVTPVDGAGNPVPTYSGTVVLQASTARGTWLLQSGTGTFADPVVDDGLATYRFPGNQSSATFLLRYRQGAQVVDVDAFQLDAPGIRDDDREGTILFSPTGFTVTSQPVVAPVTSVPPFAPVVVAGADVPVYLTAFGQAPTDAQCGVIAGYTGAKTLQFWTTRVDPAGGTRLPTVNGSAVAASEAAAGAQTVPFVAGQAVVTLKYKDVGRIAVGVKDDTSGNPQLPNGIRGGTGNFVVRPANFVVTDVRRTSDGAPNPGAASAAGAVFVAAGRPFSATVTAIDAEGGPVPNFGRESTAESVRLEAAVLLPLGGAAPPVAGTFGAFANGRASGTAFAWPEAGVVNLVPRVADGSYLGATDVVGTPTGPVGRFVPDRFEVALNTPVFRTGCNVGGFTYVGQPFGYAVPPVATVTAVSAVGTPTTNYRGALFRLANSTLGARAYSASAGTLDLAQLPAITGDPAIADLGGGVATLTFGAGGGLAFARGAPVAPFESAISLAFEVIDADGVRAPGTVVFGASGGIPFSAGAQQRYGRVLIRNAAGSELLDLPVPMTTQYWLDAARGFTANLADACTTAPALALSNWRRSLAPGETCARDGGSPGVSGIGCAAPATAAQRLRAVAAGGDFGLRLAAPGPGNSGAVTVEANVPAWLRFDWNVAVPGLENPTALATFGVFTGPASRIYRREVW